jgi:YfiH family protein
MHYHSPQFSVFFGNATNGLQGLGKRGTGQEEAEFSQLLTQALTAVTTGAAPLSITLLEQTHSTQVSMVTHETDITSLQYRSQQGDALITTLPGRALAVLTADCLPIVIYHKNTHTLAVIHAGWRGLTQGIIGATLHRMKALHTSYEVIFGPSARSCCYTVSHDFMQHIPPSHAHSMQLRNDTWYFDLPTYAQQECALLGITPTLMYTLNTCTICSPDFYSYRRNKTLQRQATIALLH